MNGMHRADMPLRGDIALVRGGGDLATGVVQKLAHAGLRVAILEVARPTAIRRTVSLCTAVFDGHAQVEDVRAVRVADTAGFAPAWAAGQVPLLVDPGMDSVRAVRPLCLVDATLAKRNLGVRAGLAPIVIALGPGFRAPRDAHAVVETMRGHTLGRVILDGEALPNTGVPGEIGGQAAARVLRAPCAGTVTPLRDIGDIVEAGERVFTVDGQTVTAPFGGLLRGMMQPGLTVSPGAKVADIDPRRDSDWHTISDKARCIGGGVLDAYAYFAYRIRQG